MDVGNLAKRIRIMLFEEFVISVAYEKRGWGLAKFLKDDVEKCVAGVLEEELDSLVGEKGES